MIKVIAISTRNSCPLEGVGSSEIFCGFKEYFIKANLKTMESLLIARFHLGSFEGERECLPLTGVHRDRDPKGGAHETAPRTTMQ